MKPFKASIDPLNAYLIRLPDGAQVEQAVSALQASGDVAWAEPNYIGHILTEPGDSALMATPNDPRRGSQWALGSGYLNMYNAWNKTEGSTAANKAVAVLDSGADMDHPDLNDKLLTSRDWDFVNGDRNPQVDHNHGSHVSGIAAAENDNLRPVAEGEYVLAHTMSPPQPRSGPRREGSTSSAIAALWVGKTSQIVRRITFCGLTM